MFKKLFQHTGTLSLWLRRVRRSQRCRSQRGRPFYSVWSMKQRLTADRRTSTVVCRVTSLQTGHHRTAMFQHCRRWRLTKLWPRCNQLHIMPHGINTDWLYTSLKTETAYIMDNISNTAHKKTIICQWYTHYVCKNAHIQVFSTSSNFTFWTSCLEQPIPDLHNMYRDWSVKNGWNSVVQWCVL